MPACPEFMGSHADLSSCRAAVDGMGQVAAPLHPSPGNAATLWTGTGGPLWPRAVQAPAFPSPWDADGSPCQPLAIFPVHFPASD